MGLFARIAARRRAKERVMPDPESAEFRDAVSASELPGSTGELGVAAEDWTSADELPADVRDSLRRKRSAAS